MVGRSNGTHQLLRPRVSEGGHGTCRPRWEHEPGPGLGAGVEGPPAAGGVGSAEQMGEWASGAGPRPGRARRKSGPFPGGKRTCGSKSREPPFRLLLGATAGDRGEAKPQALRGTQACGKSWQFGAGGRSPLQGWR